MLNTRKLKELCHAKEISVSELANCLVSGRLKKKNAVAAVKNWQKGLMKPKPSSDDVKRLATALGVEENDLAEWCSFCRYAPFSARKARLVSRLVAGRRVQDAMDILQFTHKRAASTINKVLKCAIADADEQNADVGNLYVSTARVDDAGVRIGTKRWIPKDRGRAHPISKKACHIYMTVSQE